jgi:integrase/recombinase XerD
MITDARGQIGQAIYLENMASKGQSGRVVPMSDELRAALTYASTVGIVSGRFLIESERSDGMSAQAIVNLFWRWYQNVGFDGCSSHSGRRTFITNAAKPGGQRVGSTMLSQPRRSIIANTQIS